MVGKLEPHAMHMVGSVDKRDTTAQEWKKRKRTDAFDMLSILHVLRDRSKEGDDPALVPPNLAAATDRCVSDRSRCCKQVGVRVFQRNDRGWGGGGKHQKK